MRIAALAGGVGGAKLAEGLAGVLDAEELAVIVNTADDFDHFGLRICPDLDTVCYALAHLSNPETGWGRADETWHTMEELDRLEAPTWFRLGDRDLATHLERTRRLGSGETLSHVTADFCRCWGVRHQVLPMTDDRVSTVLETNQGELEFQEYFVQRAFEPLVRGLRFSGVERAEPSAEVLHALESADGIILCPSNPFVSIGPILALRGVREAISPRRCIAVSPIVAGRALKGPAAKMFQELGLPPSARGVAGFYQGLIGGLVLDHIDEGQVSSISELGMRTLVTDIVMDDRDAKQRLAREVLTFLGAKGT